MQEQQITNLTQQPQTIRLEYCPVCKIETNHFKTPNGWQCRVCDDVIKPETKPSYPSGSLSARCDFILYEIAQGRGELTDDVIGELAELDGTDSSWNTQLLDAGYGPGGIY